jgi:hypothetical protein
MAFVKQETIISSQPQFKGNFSVSKRIPDEARFYRQTQASYTDSNGKLTYADVDEPRFDHDPITGECKGLLFEEEATNLLTGWDYHRSKMLNYLVPAPTPDYGIAPDGTKTSTLYNYSSNTGGYWYRSGGNMSTAYSGAGNGHYIYSVFIKVNSMASTEDFYIQHGSGGGIRIDNFNPNTGRFEVINNSASAFGQIYYKNGWSRVWWAEDYSSGIASSTAQELQFIGWGSGDVGTQFEAWGFQLEKRSSAYGNTSIRGGPTSYIRGSLVQNMKAADNCVIMASDIGADHRSQPITIATELANIFGEANPAPYMYPFFMKPESGNGYALMHGNPSSSASDTMTYRLADINNNITWNGAGTLSGQGTLSKMSARWDVNNCYFVSDSQSNITVDTSSAYGWIPHEIYIGNSSGYNRTLNGHIKYFYIWTSALTNDEMYEITRMHS